MLTLSYDFAVTGDLTVNSGTILCKGDTTAINEASGGTADNPHGKGIIIYGYDKGVGYIHKTEGEELGIGSRYWILFQGIQALTSLCLTKLSSYPLFDEFQRKQELIFNELKRVRELFSQQPEPGFASMGVTSCRIS